MPTAFEAIKEPTRRQILLLLGERERSVNEIAEELKAGQTMVSNHLRVLRDAGLVQRRVDGPRRMYSVDPEGLAEVIEFLEQFWGKRLKSLRQAVEEQHA